MQNINAIVTDIEGTTSSLSFVKDVLFPYARQHLPAYVRDNEKLLTKILDDVRTAENDPALSIEDVINILIRWIDEDRKVTPLKALQGLIWEAGYKNGDFQGHIYDDAVETLQGWHDAGISLYVYSSGSIPAQKLLFTHTPNGDLTPLFSGYFDTTTGPKLESASYKKIAQTIGAPAENILFLSDNPGETDAAIAAGMQAILVDRDGRDKSAVRDFHEIRLPGEGCMTAQLKLATPTGYYALTPETVCDYLSSFKNIASRLGGKSTEWKSREVGDGNLNLVFIVEGSKASVVVKQALPYVRLVGESWPLPLSRAHYEHMALVEEAKWAAEYVPEIYEHDAGMALTVMEYLSPHIILRKGLIRGIQYPRMAQHLGKFLARTLYHTSDLHLPAAEKKEKTAAFLTNTAMCKISEDLIFDEPYFSAPMNRHTAPLDDISAAFQKDIALKSAAQDMKWRFMNNAESMIHGDLHTGSVMVTETDTRIIDPEFAFYGPMGFDVGAILANLFMAFFAQPGHQETQGDRASYALWILEQAEILWQVFAKEFRALALSRNDTNPGGDVLNPRLYKGSPMLAEQAVEQRIQSIWQDTLGFAGCKIIRRIFGLAHVEDFESIENEHLRAACERKALIFARKLLINRNAFKTIGDVIRAAHED